jgi:hypothetical protein
MGRNRLTGARSGPECALVLQWLSRPKLADDRDGFNESIPALAPYLQLLVMQTLVVMRFAIIVTRNT